MADIFVSYARFDKARVSPIVAALEAQGWSVWWDPAIAPGEEFDRLIASELKRARAVVVVWTPASVESRWVRGEARDGADRGILVPLRFDQATLPIDTRALHTIDLDAWDGTHDSPLLQPLLQAIGSRLGTTTGAQQAPTGPAGPAANHAGASICVLPFANISGDPEQEYFSDGICEDVITDLSKVSSLFVVARNTSFTYKGRHVDVPQLAQRLTSRTCWRAACARPAGVMRITAQLIDGRDRRACLGRALRPRPERHFCAAGRDLRSHRPGAQAEAAAGRKQAIENRGTADVAAYDIYLRGRQLIRREKEAESRAAAELFRQATRLDPTFAAAYAGLAQILALMIFRRQELSGSMLAEATQASERALDLAPALADAWVSRAILHMVARENDAAARAYERAIAIEPRSFDAHYFYARFHVTQGGHARAIEHYEKAFTIDPSNYLPMTLSIQEHNALGDAAGARRAVEQAWAAIERRLAMDPDDSAAYDHGAGVLHALGRVEESRQFSERAIALRPDDGATHYNAACCATLAHDYPRALDLLERAVELGYGNIEWLLNDNDLVPLHGEPRFQKLVERLEARRFDGRSASSVTATIDLHDSGDAMRFDRHLMIGCAAVLALAFGGTAYATAGTAPPGPRQGRRRHQGRPGRCDRATARMDRAADHRQHGDQYAAGRRVHAPARAGRGLPAGARWSRAAACRACSPRSTPGAKHTLAIYFMYDVKHYDPAEWSSPPLEGKIVERPGEGQALVGRGAVNQKGPQMAFLTALHAFKTAGVKLPVNLVLVAEGEEEIGSTNFPTLLADPEISGGTQALGRRHDAVERPGPRRLGVARPRREGRDRSAAGRERRQVGPRPRQGHPLEPDGPRRQPRVASGQGARHAGRRRRLHAGDRRLVRECPPAHATREGTARRRAFPRTRKPSRRQLGVHHWIKDEDFLTSTYRLASQPTVNIQGLVSGYTGPGGKTVLPGRAEAKLDFRLVPDMTKDEAVEKLKAHLAKRGFGDIEVIVSGGYSPTESPEDSVVIQAGAATLKQGRDRLQPVPASRRQLAGRRLHRAAAQARRGSLRRGPWRRSACPGRMAADREQRPQGRGLRAAGGDVCRLPVRDRARGEEHALGK